MELISNRLLLAEYRALFERVLSFEAQRFPRVLKGCPEFEDSYQCFLDCQGRLVSYISSACHRVLYVLFSY